MQQELHVRYSPLLKLGSLHVIHVQYTTAYEYDTFRPMKTINYKKILPLTMYIILKHKSSRMLFRLRYHVSLNNNLATAVFKYIFI